MRTLFVTLHSRYVHASLALPYLAAYCEPSCGPIEIREFNVNQPKENLLAEIASSSADVIGFSVYLWNRIITLELVCCLKQINPRLRIILGGPEISYENDDFFGRYPVDAIIRGEGEVPLHHLLSAWRAGRAPTPLAGLQTPDGVHPDGESLLDDLDLLPSPFALGRVDLSRGLVYYESSRGCPYQCSFCLSARSKGVRSFSMERIRADLSLLMHQGVKLIKFVDRTFNYDAARARDIFRFILANNRCSAFHFEIGAHLLDRATLELLEQVPPETFQFEIGVQSTLPQTLRQVSRKVPLELLAENVRALRARTAVHLHLDLVAGLPEEPLPHFLDSIDFTCELGAHHLQIELVKLLPGTPLRERAQQLGLLYDAAPPYRILATPVLSFADLERIRGIGRLNDLLVNSGKFVNLIAGLSACLGSLSACLDDLDSYWRHHQLYAVSRSLRDLVEEVDRYLCCRFSAARLAWLRETLARDYARSERIVSGSAPAFFNLALTAEEQAQVRQRVRKELADVSRTGKVQYCSAVFEHLPDLPGRRVLIFLYVSRTADGLSVQELLL
ncbi:MAG: DUF4080 domain-containing protein [Pelovirga sp.]